MRSCLVDWGLASSPFNASFSNSDPCLGQTLRMPLKGTRGNFIYVGNRFLVGRWAYRGARQLMYNRCTQRSAHPGTGTLRRDMRLIIVHYMVYYHPTTSSL